MEKAGPPPLLDAEARDFYSVAPVRVPHFGKKFKLMLEILNRNPTMSRVFR